MNLNLRKTVLLVSACAAVGFACPAYASGDTAPQAVQQSKSVSGTVVGVDGPVIGATVLEKGTSNGTVTDIDGNFSLNVQPGATLVILCGIQDTGNCSGQSVVYQCQHF